MPRWCLRRVTWRPREIPRDPAYPPESAIFEGFRAMTSEILFLGKEQDRLAKLIARTRTTFNEGLAVRPASRPDHPMEEIRIGIRCGSTEHTVIYVPGVTEHVELEEIVSTWIDKAFALQPEATIVPDSGTCRLSYPTSINERIVAQWLYGPGLRKNRLERRRQRAVLSNVRARVVAMPLCASVPPWLNHLSLLNWSREERTYEPPRHHAPGKPTAPDSSSCPGDLVVICGVDVVTCAGRKGTST
jgi:hypothetical protein